MSFTASDVEEIKRYLKFITILLVILVIIVTVVVAIGFAEAPKENALLETINNNTKIQDVRSDNATEQRLEQLNISTANSEKLDQILGLIQKGMINVTIVNQTSS